MTSRSRGWCITVNNPSEGYLDRFKAYPDMDYCVVGSEVAPTTGTTHYQAYVHWPDAKTLSVMRNMFPRAHLTPALGTALQNQAYCSKENVIYEHGTPPAQGKRTDQDAIRTLLRQGANMRQIADIAPNAGVLRLAENWMRMHEEPRDQTYAPEVRWYHGLSGSGKTKTALEWLGPDTHICLDKGKWWDGYDQHNGVLIDDFREKWCSFERLLRLLDRYPCTVEVKGGTRQLRAMKIAITAPFPPNAYYLTLGEDRVQLLRRITRVIDVDNTCPSCGWTFGNDCVCNYDVPGLIESNDSE